MSTDNFRYRSKTNIPASFSQLHPFVSVAEADGSVVLREAHQAVTRLSDDINLLITPMAALAANAFNQSVSFEIEIRPTELVLEHINLVLTVRESGGANSVSLVPAPLMINRIEFYSNSGSYLMQTIYGESLYLSAISLPEFVVMANAASGNYNYPGLGPTAALAAGATAAYTVNLNGAFCEQMKGGLFLSGLTGGIICRVWTNGATVTGGTGTLSVVGAALINEYRKLTPDDISYLGQLYRENTLHFPIVDHTIQSFTQPFNANTTYNLTLSAINGDVTMLLVLFKTGNSGTAQHAFVAIPPATTFGLLDGNAKSLNDGASAMRADFLKNIKAPKRSLNRILQNVNVIGLFHGDPQDMFNGVKNGLMPYDGKFQLQIIFDNAWTSGTYICDVMAFRWRHVDIVKGKIIPNQS